MRGKQVTRIKPFDPDAYGAKRLRHAFTYKAFIPDPITEFEFHQSSNFHAWISEAENLIKELDFRPQLAPLMHFLMRSESIASSRIEGLRVEANTLLRAEAKLVNGQRIGEIAKEVIANIEAMEKAISVASQASEFTLEDLNLIHETLMKNSNTAQYAGKIRTIQNFIGKEDSILTADFVPPPPEELPALLEDLIGAINEKTLSPLAQAAIIHAQFETIHPYIDGNGRTGRALIHVVLRRRGLTTAFITPISIFFARSRDYYISGLENYRNNNIEAWLEFFVGAARRSTDMAAQYLVESSHIKEQWIRKIISNIKPRRDAAIWKVVEELFSKPITNIDQLCAATGNSKNAISSAVSQLEKVGILKISSNITRNRVWEAREVLELLEKLNNE